MSYDNQGPPRSEPAFFAPPLLLFLIGFMLAIHAYRALVLGLFEEADVQLLRLTAFVPARFSVAIDLADLADLIGRPSRLPRFLQENRMDADRDAADT